MVQRPHHDGGPAAAVPGPAGKRPPGMAGANPGPAPVCGKIYHLQGVLNRERTKEETSHESYQTPDGRAAGVPDAAVSAAGSVGHEKAFLIQNMCPITEKYMKNEYLDSVSNIPVRVDGRLEKELKDKAGKVLALQRKGAKLIFPDVLSIEQELLKQM